MLGPNDIVDVETVVRDCFFEALTKTKHLHTAFLPNFKYCVYGLLYFKTLYYYYYYYYYSFISLTFDSFIFTHYIMIFKL